MKTLKRNERRGGVFHRFDNVLYPCHEYFDTVERVARFLPEKRLTSENSGRRRRLEQVSELGS